MAAPNAGKGPLGVVIVYAFDSTKTTPAYTKLDEVFWMVHEKLTRVKGSSLGYIYQMSTPNTYICDMKLVDPTDSKANGYKVSPVWRKTNCTKNMASGLAEAHKLLSDGGHSNNGTIIFFSDGLVNKGDFFDGAEQFVSKFPVHTFTVGGDAYNQGLRTIAANSPGGTFNPAPVGDNPKLSAPFSQLIDGVFSGVKAAFIAGQARPLLNQNELHFHLYMHMYGRYEPEIVKANDTHKFGQVNANDYPIYDGVGPDAKLVARLQGLQCNASSQDAFGGWHHTFSILFQDASGFKGSKLHVMGCGVSQEDAAIVGGTGEFALARGVIYKKFKEQNGNGCIIELDIHAIYSPIRRTYTEAAKGDVWML